MNLNSLQLHVNTDQDLIPCEVPSQRVLEIAVQAPDAPQTTNRSNLNLALVIDRSGSMSGAKLEYAKQAALYVLDQLDERDRVALVSFDSEVSLLAPSTPVSTHQRNELKRQVYPIRPGGSTNLSGGWFTGCQEVAASDQAEMLNRVLLLTDGQANLGIVDLEELAGHARQLCIRGVTTSTFGVGRGFNEHLLEAMSNQGGGNFYYIETPSEIPELFLREFKELAAVTARDVEMVLVIPPQVSVQVLGGWRSELSAGQLRLFVGNLYSGRRQELYLKLLTPPAGGLPQISIRVKVTARTEDDQKYENEATVILQYANQSESEAAPKKRDVLERYARVDLADTANEALKLERRGENERAHQMLHASVLNNRPYIDPSQADEYERMSDRMRRGMDEDDRKHSHYATYNRKRQR